MKNKDPAGFKFVYILLDGVSDLPHPTLNDSTPLDAAYTPNMDYLAKNGCMGEIITVGEGIAPQSDIAVFNMLGYSFRDANYVGRGVIEAIGSDIDFRDGDLAMRGNFGTVDDKLQIIDRRAGRNIQHVEANEVCQTLAEEIKFSDREVSLVIKPTIGHRVSIRFRHATLNISDKITNTDPAYQKVDGMGIAKPDLGQMRLEKSYPEEPTESAAAAAKIVNEFSEQVIRLLKDHPTNKRRLSSGKTPMNAILLRDSGNTVPKLESIKKKYDLDIASIVDLPVEIGISRVLGMETLKAGDINDYERKAIVAVDNLEHYDGIYVHIKGPDEFGHDGDAQGKKRSIEDIDRLFFGMLRNRIKRDGETVVISADHSTPCIKKAHSADPVPVLISGGMIKKDESARFTEKYASTGRLGRMMGSMVLRTAIDMMKINSRASR
ncbi:MAG TPA: alkaline phosphatase family protein [Candidatus Nitrosopolaris sp.]|nr:alkaline phosphatase family protein [Candidatus Nitrosopolaris sp.]